MLETIKNASKEEIAIVAGAAVVGGLLTAGATYLVGKFRNKKEDAPAAVATPVAPAATCAE